MRKTFFAKYCFVILFAVCFCTPLVLRGAKDALARMKNDVMDWLPSRFKETGDIEWFWRHFAGERFIIVTWEGCRGGLQDEAFHLFKKKLAPAIPPSKQGLPVAAPPSKDPGSTWLERPFDFIGDRLGLYALSNNHRNWGGLDEKWLRGEGGKWYYILPSGDLYAFDGFEGPIPSLARELARWLGRYELTGKPLASFGPKDGPWYYRDPNRLSAQFFRSVVTGPDMLNELVKQNESGVSMMSEKEAMDKLTGVLFGPDGKQTALVVTVTDAGRRDFHRVLGRGVLGKERGLLYKIADECGISADQLKLGGPPVDNVAIDEEGTITLVRLVSLCVVLGLTLSYISFRSIIATIVLFCTGGLSAALGMAIVGWSGDTPDAVMMSMPALVYVLGISGAVHIINYYREAVDEHGMIGGPERALAHAWKPAVLCNITTGFGLLSLCSAEVVPIRKFGIFAAAGVMCTLILLFSYVPAALQMWPLNLPKKVKRKDGAESWLDAFLADYWERFGSWIIRHYVFVGTACVLTIAVVGYGVTKINTTVNLLELFDRHAKIIKDYAFIEQNVGVLVPMEVVVKFSPDSVRKTEDELAIHPQTESQLRASFSPVDRVEAVGRVQQYVARYLGDAGAGVVGQSMSAVSFTRKLPSATDYRGRMAFDAGLLNARDQLLKSEFFKIDKDDGSELWRISLRVAAFKGIDYGDFVQDLREVVEPVMAAYNVRYQTIHGSVDRQMQQLAPGEHTGAIRVAFVLPDELAKEAFPPPAPKKRASEKAKEDAELAAAEETEAGAGSEQLGKTQYVSAQINQDLIFTQSLYTTLRSARVGVERIVESKISKELLSGLDAVILVGDLEDATKELVQANAVETIDGKAILAASLAASAASTGPAGSQPPADLLEHQTTSAVFTGVVPIVYKAQRTLLTSLIDSTTWSFLTITPLMILVSRSIPAGLVAMLPNALPVLVIFGAMGWMGIRIDIGSMMTASIALGVAVDDTIHFLTWFREELERTKDRKLAILGAYRRCATPTFQAALISGLGLSIFAFSTFTPTQRFGYLMLAILFCGVVAELVFFPALLASPLGAVFKPRTKPEDGSDEGGQRDERPPGPESPPTLRIETVRDASKRIALF